MVATAKSNLDALVKRIDTSTTIDAYQLAVQAEMLAIRQENEDEIANIQLILTNILIKNQAYKEALQKNYSALQYFREVNVQDKIAKCWKYMALIYGYLGNKQKQLDYNKKCLSLNEELGNTIEIIKILNNIGYTYYELQEYDKAEAIFKGNLDNPNLTEDLHAVSLKNLGIVFFNKADFDKAKTTFKITMSIAEKYHLPTYINASKYFLANIYFKEKQYQKALSYLLDSTRYLETKNAFKKELLMNYELLIKALTKLGLVEEVDEYFNKYVVLNKFINKQTKDQSISNLQFKFEISETEKERALLEEKNKELTNANQIIEEQAKQLQAGNQELTEFAHRVAHDLKQPVRTINNFVGLFERELKGNMTDRAKDFMNFIMNATTEMTQFIDDILKYASSDQSQQPATSVDCNIVLEKIKKRLTKQLEETNGSILCDKLPVIQAHPPLLLQVFQNLISNAIKFRREGVPPILKIRGIETDTTNIIEIEDNGIGIKPEDQEKVFKLFTRLHTKSAIEGSGIGLSTVSKILKRYNATIELSSVYGIGSTFRITFPKN